METYILSQRGISSGSAFGFIYELEDLLARICECQILIPKANSSTIWSHKQSPKIASTLKKAINKTIGLYQKIDINTFSSHQSKHLFVICLNPSGLSMLDSIENWRKKFDTVSAFVIDAWLFTAYPKETSQIDHLFIPNLEAIESLERKLNIPVSLLPFGADILLNGSNSLDRPIDIMSFGRTPVAFHKELSKKLNNSSSKYVYYRHPELECQWHPKNDNYKERTDHEFRLLFHKMMRRSKIVLAFDPLFETDELYGAYKINARPWKFQHSVLSLRWIEGCSAGCVILGKRPKTILADQLLNWKDVTIELPQAQSQWLKFTEELLEDIPRLQAIHQRNYLESLAQHDWRYRIRDMYQALNLDIPPKLVKELNLITEMLKACK